MSCLKNLLILIFVVGLLIYITEESKQKEKFTDSKGGKGKTVVGSLLDSEIQLSKKQINNLNDELSSEESKNRLISELNSEVTNTQSVNSEIQPVEQEVNYAVIGRDNRNKLHSRPVAEEEVSSKMNINQTKYSQFVEEELDRRVSYNTNKNRINQQIEEAYLSGYKKCHVVTGQGAMMREIHTWASNHSRIRECVQTKHNPGSFSIKLKKRG